MNQWNQICDYLLRDPECEDIHKLIWPSAGFGHISGVPYTANHYPNGRVKITPETSLETVKVIVRLIKRKRREQ